MKSLSKLRLLAILALIIFSAGCAGKAVKFESIAGQAYDTSKGREVEATKRGLQLLWVIPIMTNSRQARAYQVLCDIAGDDYVITNVKIQEYWRYALVGTVYGTTMRATLYPKIN
jgi:hypothetical protein